MIGGSSYIGGCIAANPITYLPGVIGTTSTQTMPGGSTRSDYISGVGVGNVGVWTALQSPGGNGAIVLTFTPITASPSRSPSSSIPSTAVPSSSAPSLSPTYFPSTNKPSSPPLAAPSTAAPTLSPSAAPSTVAPTSSPSAAPSTVEPTPSPSPALMQIYNIRDCR